MSKEADSLRRAVEMFGINEAERRCGNLTAEQAAWFAARRLLLEKDKTIVSSLRQLESKLASELGVRIKVSAEWSHPEEGQL